MVYLRGLYVKTLILTITTLVILSLSQDVEAGVMKIAYKKPIFGKINAIKDKRFRLRPDYSKKVPADSESTMPDAATSSTTMTSTTTTTPIQTQAVAPTELNVEQQTTPMLPEADNTKSEAITDRNNDNEAAVNGQEIEKELGDKRLEEVDNTHMQFMGINRLGGRATADLLPNLEPLMNNTLEEQLCQQKMCEIANIAETQRSTRVDSNAEANDEIEELFPLPAPEFLIAPRSSTIRNTPTKVSKSSTVGVTESERPVPCTCGVFLASQIKRGAKEPPEGTPVITNELDRTFPCNQIGQKQCQTKCLEAIVQHLPNSASILCASLNRDCRKERAYLFIKNCRNQWFNTNLAAGREYCCRNGQPYPCPLV
ncbi:uncharacterized protein LOC129239525 [Anastrepha obliqua]|uniref:uncharacterized protein LOC129239525 n=1 Tax=Anastrepha obliqua TaxID=95512 RepID=UPI002409C0D3|nr:uncharacterized protein LOC129239525 [Anastrepha obliqua]